MKYWTGSNDVPQAEVQPTCHHHTSKDGIVSVTQPGVATPVQVGTIDTVDYTIRPALRRSDRICSWSPVPVARPRRLHRVSMEWERLCRVRWKPPM